MNSLFYIVGKFKLLYRIPPGYWVMITAVFLILWTALMLFLYRKDPAKQYQSSLNKRRYSKRVRAALIINLILMLVGLVIILLVTFVRRGSSEHQVILIPLRVLFGNRAPRDYWHVSIMNIVLYVPFASGFAFCLRYGRFGYQIHAALITVLVCFVFSFVAEAMQYILGAGLSEVDDVLMNTLGGLIGTAPCYVVSKRSLVDIRDKSKSKMNQYRHD